MTEPVHRTILLFDIEKFGRRDDVEQALLRRKLHDVVEDTLAAAGVEAAAQHREDRGDGVLILIGSEHSKVRLLRTLITDVPALLHSYNRLAASSVRIRLRAVLASGEVALHEQPGTLGGAVGHDLNQAFRLLDAEPLRTALRDSSEDCALCVSDAVHQGVVRHGHRGVRAECFRRVAAAGKEGDFTAWLYGASGSAASADAGTPGAHEDGALRLPRDGGTGAGAGPVVMGDQYGVAGGLVGGDLHFTFDRKDRR